VSGRRKQERERDPPAPGGIERDLDDAAALVGMDEAVGLRDDAAVLGDGARAHPKEQQRAGHDVDHFDHHPPRRLGERLARACLAPVAAVGRDRHRLGPVELAPDPAHEAEAVAADAADARLVVVGRAEPAARRGDHLLGVCRSHITSPAFASPRFG
jgi:hypothetical protein